MPLGLVLLPAKNFVIIPLDLEQLLEVVLAVDHCPGWLHMYPSYKLRRERKEGREKVEEREGGRARKGRE